MLALVPDRNLVTNIGFGNQASHTRDSLPSMAGLPIEAMTFPLSHPTDVYLDRDADDLSFRQIYPWIVENQSYYWQLRHKFVATLPEPLREKIRLLRSKAGAPKRGSS
jgi:hypothetical protein